MIDPFTIAMIGSTAMSAFGQMKAAKSAKLTAQMDAFNLETQKKVGKAQANENAVLRREQYIQNRAANIATFSAAGRDVSNDMSARAFLQKQKETVGKDIKTAARTGLLEANKIQQQAIATRVDGRARAQSATIGAYTTIASGAARYYQVKGP